MARSIDLNCDVGESTAADAFGRDAELLDCVTSANIACGMHAGNPSTMRRTVRLAIDKNVAIGAHPGLPDREGFGRRAIAVLPQEVYDLVLYQLGALQAFVQAEGARLRHVKPHGALYNMAAKDLALAQAIAAAVERYDRRLVLVGLAGSELIRAGQAAGLPTAAEAFADRNYEADGSLTSRDLPDALLTDPTAAAERAASLLLHGTLRTRQQTDLAIHADTLCIHGDSPDALAIAKAVRKRLEMESIEVRAFVS